MGKYRISFLTGLATGFVLGARAGRERYDQIVKTARSVADNPAVQQAAGVVQARASGLAAAAGSRISSEVRVRAPQLAAAAKTAGAKVGEKVPGLGGHGDGAAAEDGAGDPAGDSGDDGGRHHDGNGHRNVSGTSFTSMSQHDSNPGH
jgi:hypothetical protein